MSALLVIHHGVIQEYSGISKITSTPLMSRNINHVVSENVESLSYDDKIPVLPTCEHPTNNLGD
jgi:hypothetical protein